MYFTANLIDGLTELFYWIFETEGKTLDVFNPYTPVIENCTSLFVNLLPPLDFNLPLAQLTRPLLAQRSF